MESMSLFSSITEEHEFLLMNKDEQLALFKVVGTGVEVVKVYKEFP